jgi:hypothetical protein
VKAILRLFDVDTEKEGAEAATNKQMLTIADDMDEIKLGSDDKPYDDADGFDDNIEEELEEIEVVLDLDEIRDTIQPMRSTILKVSTSDSFQLRDAKKTTSSARYHLRSSTRQRSFSRLGRTP